LGEAVAEVLCGEWNPDKILTAGAVGVVFDRVFQGAEGFIGGWLNASSSSATMDRYPKGGDRQP
jgi:hypothetical protein